MYNDVPLSFRLTPHNMHMIWQHGPLAYLNRDDSLRILAPGAKITEALLQMAGQEKIEYVESPSDMGIINYAGRTASIGGRLQQHGRMLETGLGHYDWESRLNSGDLLFTCLMGGLANVLARYDGRAIKLPQDQIRVVQVTGLDSEPIAGPRSLHA